MDMRAREVTDCGPAQWNRRMVLGRMALGVGALAATAATANIAQAVPGGGRPGNDASAWTYDQVLPRLRTTTPWVWNSNLTEADRDALDLAMQKIAANTVVKPTWSSSRVVITLTPKSRREAEIIAVQGDFPVKKDGTIVNGDGRCQLRTSSGTCARASLAMDRLNPSPAEPARRAHVIEHELLHTLGVGHCWVPESLMYPYLKREMSPTVMGENEYAEVNRIYQ